MENNDGYEARNGRIECAFGYQSWGKIASFDRGSKSCCYVLIRDHLARANSSRGPRVCALSVRKTALGARSLQPRNGGEILDNSPSDDVAVWDGAKRTAIDANGFAVAESKIFVCG